MAVVNDQWNQTGHEHNIQLSTVQPHHPARPESQTKLNEPHFANIKFPSISVIHIKYTEFRLPLCTWMYNLSAVERHMLELNTVLVLLGAKHYQMLAWGLSFKRESVLNFRATKWLESNASRSQCWHVGPEWRHLQWAHVHEYNPESIKNARLSCSIL